MDMINGYVFVDLTGENVYKKALGAIRAKKPVLVKDYDQIYYADNITTKTVDDDLVVVITKGGKTITITNANTVSSEGLVANPTMENIKDLAGHNRFIEGTFDLNEISGVTYTYQKWSLSGSHLMIVVAGNVADGTTINTGALGSLELPKWVYDKIYPIINDDVIRTKLTFIDATWTDQTTNLALVKTSTEGILQLFIITAITMSTDKSFRIQLDLVIDNN